MFLSFSVSLLQEDVKYSLVAEVSYILLCLCTCKEGHRYIQI